MVADRTSGTDGQSSEDGDLPGPECLPHTKACDAAELHAQLPLLLQLALPRSCEEEPSLQSSPEHHQESIRHQPAHFIAAGSKLDGRDMNSGGDGSLATELDCQEEEGEEEGDLHELEGKLREMRQALERAQEDIEVSAASQPQPGRAAALAVAEEREALWLRLLEAQGELARVRERHAAALADLGACRREREAAAECAAALQEQVQKRDLALEAARTDLEKRVGNVLTEVNGLLREKDQWATKVLTSELARMAAEKRAMETAAAAEAAQLESRALQGEAAALQSRLAAREADAECSAVELRQARERAAAAEAVAEARKQEVAELLAGHRSDAEQLEASLAAHRAGLAAKEQELAAVTAVHRTAVDSQQAHAAELEEQEAALAIRMAALEAERDRVECMRQDEAVAWQGERERLAAHAAGCETTILELTKKLAAVSARCADLEAQLAGASDALQVAQAASTDARAARDGLAVALAEVQRSAAMAAEDAQQELEGEQACRQRDSATAAAAILALEARCKELGSQLRAAATADDAERLALAERCAGLEAAALEACQLRADQAALAAEAAGLRQRCSILEEEGRQRDAAVRHVEVLLADGERQAQRAACEEAERRKRAAALEQALLHEEVVQLQRSLAEQEASRAAERTAAAREQEAMADAFYHINLELERARGEVRRGGIGGSLPMALSLLPPLSTKGGLLKGSPLSRSKAPQMAA
eukprot:SM000076S21767  [mRNA]  locus=s76:157023:159703:- [translate_table: standard]